MGKKALAGSDKIKLEVMESPGLIVILPACPHGRSLSTKPKR
jgi:hypothetical protein